MALSRVILWYRKVYSVYHCEILHFFRIVLVLREAEDENCRLRLLPLACLSISRVGRKAIFLIAQEIIKLSRNLTSLQFLKHGFLIAQEIIKLSRNLTSLQFLKHGFLIFLFIIFPFHGIAKYEHYTTSKIALGYCQRQFSRFQKIALAEYAAAPAKEEWKIIESKYCTILCHPDADIKKVNNKIKIRFYDIDWGRYSSKNKSVEEQLAEKFDCIFQKVEKILDMYPRKIHPKVKIYKNQAQLDDTFGETFGYANAKARSSYYVHKYTTIYTTQQTISRGVLAHEMGHAVIDHYFLILPPEKVSELLTQYVEMHLED